MPYANPTLVYLVKLYSTGSRWGWHCHWHWRWVYWGWRWVCRVWYLVHKGWQWRFGYKHASISSAKSLCWGSKPMRGLNTNEFMFWRNIGLLLHMGKILTYYATIYIYYSVY